MADILQRSGRLSEGSSFLVVEPTQQMFVGVPIERQTGGPVVTRHYHVRRADVFAEIHQTWLFEME